MAHSYKKPIYSAVNISVKSFTAFCPRCDSQLNTIDGCLHIPIETKQVTCKCTSIIKFDFKYEIHEN